MQGTQEMVKKLPLLKIYLIFIVVCATLASGLDTYSLFSPKVFSLMGLFGVLATRVGLAIGFSFWAFTPALIYRGYLYIFNKTYSLKKEQIFLVIGFGLVVLALKGLMH